MKQKRLISIFISLALFIPAFLTDKISGYFPVYFPLYVLSYAAAGWNVFKKAFVNISHGQIFDENFLMLIASVGAFILNLVFSHDSLFLPNGGEEMMDGVAVMILYQIGEHFQAMAVKKSRGNIRSLLSLRPDSALVYRDGIEVEVFPDEILPGNEFIAHPGQKIALDGTIESGEGYVNTSAITGESEPRFIKPGDEVLSGFVSLDSDFTVKATKPFEESTVSKMLRMIEEAAEKKAKQETFITKFAMVYTPAVCILSLLVGVIPPLFILLFSGVNAWNTWIYNALCLLVISCPCALVISVPLTFFGGIGGIAKANVLIKGADCFEGIARADTVAFDKTGTLTTGVFEVKEVLGEDREKVLALAAACEKSFSHPIARSIVAANEKDLFSATDIKDHSGKGISACVNGKRVLIGNEKLMTENGISPVHIDSPFTTVHVAYDGKELGQIICADKLRAETPKAIKALADAGMTTVMLTGDRKEVADAIGKEAGIGKVYSSLLPQDKTEIIRKMQDDGRKVIFAGDGINDAPAIATANIGCAMGGAGSDAAIETADMVIMKDSIDAVATAKRHAKKVIRVANENIYGSLAIKLILMVLTLSLPFFPLYIAIIGDVGVCLVAIANAMRTLRI